MTFKAYVGYVEECPDFEMSAEEFRNDVSWCLQLNFQRGQQKNTYAHTYMEIGMHKANLAKF